MGRQAPDLITPVILSGGTGSRLWPLSRAGYPKQFLPLAGSLTMIQETAQRVAGVNFAAPVIICNEDHRFIVAEQLRVSGCRPDEILLEPVAKNTAPAVAIAALHIQKALPDRLMLVMPSDHVIEDKEAFLAAVARAIPSARDGALVTFGITPDRPETGYGYIKGAEEIAGHAGVHTVEQFVEKPDEETARAYLANGRYYWNSGIFLFSAQAYLSELERLNPLILAASQKALDLSERDLTFTRVDKSAFSASPSISIDYAVMEKTTKAAVVPVSMGWNDLGAWSALWDIGLKDPMGNVTQGDVMLLDTKNSYVRSEHGFVAVIGLEDVIIATTDDATLVASRSRVQEVKQIVTRLNAEGREIQNLHSTVHRPWGTYRNIDKGERYQVKRIVVQPGERLSLQMHHHRAEHWIVVSGMARVTRGNSTFLLGENESTYISVGETHRLENPGKVPLHLIEVQSGGYLDEDDIVRFEDGYGRVTVQSGLRDTN